MMDGVESRDVSYVSGHVFKFQRTFVAGPFVVTVEHSRDFMISSGEFWGPPFPVFFRSKRGRSLDTR